MMTDPPPPDNETLVLLTMVCLVFGLMGTAGYLAAIGLAEIVEALGQ